MTLTKPDTGQAPSERSMTVEARSVRWGNDGVGLEFVVDQGSSGTAPHQLAPIDRRVLENFLKRNGKPARS
jgi:hypothetical protein